MNELGHTTKWITSQHNESTWSKLDAAGDFSAILEGGGLTPPPLPPAILPLQSIGEDSGILDYCGFTPPPMPAPGVLLGFAGNCAGMGDESGLTQPITSLNLEYVPASSRNSDLQSDSNGDRAQSPQDIPTAATGIAGQSDWPNINLGTVELMDTETRKSRCSSASSMDISSEDEPQSSARPPCVVGLTTEQMEGTNYIHLFETFHANMHVAEWTKVIDKVANLDTNICRIPNLQTECKYLHCLGGQLLIHLQ